MEGTPATNNAIFIQTTTPRVGIGTSNPQAKLDVDGDIKINVNPSQQYALTIDTNSNPSDGYIVSITTNGGFNVAGSTFVVRNGKVLIGDIRSETRCRLQVDNCLSAGQYSSSTRYCNNSIVGEGNYNDLTISKPYGAIFLSAYGNNASTTTYPNAGSIIFKTTNSSPPIERMRIYYNGNVGIGTDNPQAKLDVDGDIKASTITANRVGIGTNDPQAELDVSGQITSNKLYVNHIYGNPDYNREDIVVQQGNDYGKGFVLRNNWGDAIILENNCTGAACGRILINNTGLNAGIKLSTLQYDPSYINTTNVGIGITNPQSRLHIVETDNSKNYILVASTATDSASYKLVVSTTGYVGINKTTPSYNLDVNGNINLTGNLYKNGQPLAGTGDAVLSATQTWTGRNTFNNNTIFNSSITINANPSQQYALTIDSNSNSSDGYIVSITTNGAIRLSGISSAVSTSGNGVIYYSSTQNKFLKSENGGSAMPLADPLVLQKPIKFTLDTADGLQTAASVSGSGIIHSIMFRIGHYVKSDFNLIIDGVTIISATNIQAGSNNNNYVLFLTPNLSWCSTGSDAEPSEVTPTTNACVNANLGFGFKSSFSIKADGYTTEGGVVRVVYSLYK